MPPHRRWESVMAGRVAVPDSMDLGSWTARRAAIGPDHPAVTYGDETLSYAQFQHRIDCLADQLVAGGVGSGDRVAYLGPNHSAFLISLFACARSGATFVPLNFRLTGPELAYILDDCGATTLIADATLTSVVDEVRSDLSTARYVAVGGHRGGKASTTSSLSARRSRSRCSPTRRMSPSSCTPRAPPVARRERC